MKLLSNLAAKSFIVNRSTERDLDEVHNRLFWPSSGDSYDGEKELATTFEEYVEKAYKANGIVFACVQARSMPFSEARFQYQEMPDGNPGKLSSGPGLDILETPWTNATTGELLTRMEQDASTGGNSYYTPVNGRLRRMRPDWVTIISGVMDDDEGSSFDLGAEVLGYGYKPPGRPLTLLSPSRVVHYSPLPDPLAQWRGMSWLTPVLREISADSQMTQHKLKFLKQGASLKFAIKYDPSLTPTQVTEHAAVFKALHEGTENAYRTLHIGGGAEPVTVGTSLKELDFKLVQGAGETRIAAAAGVGAIMARFSEGLAGSSLNQGNYEAAKRQFADMTLRPLWRVAAGSLQKLTSPPDGSRLWYDTRDVEFLKADRKDAAEIQSLKAATIAALTTSGYTPSSAIDAVEADDFSRLEHSGLYSIQLQPPNSGTPPAA